MYFSAEPWFANIAADGLRGLEMTVPKGENPSFVRGSAFTRIDLDGGEMVKGILGDVQMMCPWME